MKAHHYTTFDNWLKIQFEGLIPYEIDREEIARHFEDGLRGIWLWDVPLSQEEEMWFLMSRAAVMKSLRLVKLEVNYNQSDLLVHPDYLSINVHHTLVMGEYIGGDLSCIITTEPIPPEDITLLRDFDFLHLNPPDIGVAVNEETQTADALR